MTETGTFQIQIFFKFFLGGNKIIRLTNLMLIKVALGEH